MPRQILGKGAVDRPVTAQKRLEKRADHMKDAVFVQQIGKDHGRRLSFVDRKVHVHGSTQTTPHPVRRIPLNLRKRQTERTAKAQRSCQLRQRVEGTRRQTPLVATQIRLADPVRTLVAPQ